ncbi:MAG: HAMP domain-containing protein, partial [Acidobacteria bacterium]|nr:HAMP domain-containing protein [Acidobacteriota bacterium]
NVRDDAVSIVRQVLRDREERAREFARLVAENPALQQKLARGDAAGAEQVFSPLAEHLRLDWAAVVDNRAQVLALHRAEGSQVDFLPQLPQLLGPQAAIAYTTAEEMGGMRFAVARVRVETSGGKPLGAVVVAQALPRELLAKAADIESESQAYEAITRERKTYRWQAVLILLLITILLLLATTWSALHLAQQVTVPIQALAVATQEISQGNLDYRVEVPARDELGNLVTSFNQMTAQLRDSRRRLEQAVAELERRRQWMEAILESIPTGVITLGPHRRILAANDAARKLLGRPVAEGSSLSELLGREAAEACGELFARAGQMGFAAAERELHLEHRIAHVAVSVSALRAGPGEGYVLVLDDLTDLLKAQKAAAWQEVAQRIAHEIKNPLTPIQLSADRIRRYLERLPAADAREDDRYRQLIARCASLIGQEVHGLKLLVDEFSRFARFPAAQPVPTQLNEIVQDALALYADSANGIQFRSELAGDLPAVPADAALLRRVLLNLLENAAEAVARAERKEIVVRTRYLASQKAIELSVTDSGPGISAEDKERLFLPFFSTKPEGMGLGLAIVSRIVAEHHGRIHVEDNRPSGARFVVELPVEAPVLT